MQDTPGGPVPTTLVGQLTGIALPARLVEEFLTARGYITDDRTPAVDAWFTRVTAGLPEPMAGQLAYWMDIRLHGHAQPPRSRPRSETTVRHQLRFALPVLTRLAGTGLHDLADVAPHQLRAQLEACRLTGTGHTHTASALRAVFTTLAAHRTVTSNPAVHLRVGSPVSTIPLPADPAPVREALTSPDPARAAVTALIAFHALRVAEIRQLPLEDTRHALTDGRLLLPGRTVRLAGPVRVRLAAYLEHRTRCWPRTANRYFFVTRRTALTTVPVSRPWLYRCYPASSLHLREDRIVEEVRAADADVPTLCRMFGLSVEAATRYSTAATTRPG